MTSVYLQQEAKISRIAAEWQDRPGNISEFARTHCVPYQRLPNRMVGKNSMQAEAVEKEAKKNTGKETCKEATDSQSSPVLMKCSKISPGNWERIAPPLTM